MQAIFISYRREDVEGHAGRLFQDLALQFGKGSVFMDVAGIHPGLDFRRVLEKQLASCGVLLAVIGDTWTSIKNDAGLRRIDDPADLVRLEIAAALRREIPVVPVLVRGARLPRQDELPDDLKDLVYRNAFELTHVRWESDVAALIEALRRVLPEPDKPDPRNIVRPEVAPSSSETSGWMMRLILILGVLVLTMAGYLFFGPGQTHESVPAPTAASQPAVAPLPNEQPAAPISPKELVAANPKPAQPVASAPVAAVERQKRIVATPSVKASSPTVNPNSTPAPAKCTITIMLAPLMSAPDLFGERLAILRGRHTLEVLEIRNYQHMGPIPMYKVSIDGMVGWITNDSVERVGPGCAAAQSRK
jgi:TIR domain